MSPAHGRTALQGHAEHFFQGRFPKKDFGKAILEHGLHASGYRLGPDDGGILPLHDHAADLIVDLKQFEHSYAAAEAAAMALSASLAAKEANTSEQVLAFPQDTLILRQLDRPIEIGPHS